MLIYSNNLLAIPFFCTIPAKELMFKVRWVSNIANWPKVKNACLGSAAVQLGFPLPASKIILLFKDDNFNNLSLN